MAETLPAGTRFIKSGMEFETTGDGNCRFVGAAPRGAKDSIVEAAAPTKKPSARVSPARPLAAPSVRSQPVRVIYRTRKPKPVYRHNSRLEVCMTKREDESWSVGQVYSAALTIIGLLVFLVSLFAAKH